MSGYYQVNFSAECFTSAADTAYRVYEIQKNGSTVANITEGNGTTDLGSLFTASVSAVIDMNGSSDYLTTMVRQNTGSDMPVKNRRFSVYYIHSL